MKSGVWFPRAAAISRVFRTSSSAPSKSLGWVPLERALLYMVQGGEAQMAETPSSRRSSGMTHRFTSQQNVAFARGSLSTDTTSQPMSRKALPMEPVPEKSSSSTGIFILFRVRSTTVGEALINARMILVERSYDVVVFLPRQFLEVSQHGAMRNLPRATAAEEDVPHTSSDLLQFLFKFCPAR